MRSSRLSPEHTDNSGLTEEDRSLELLTNNRAPVAFGRRAVPQLFEELQQPEEERRQRALNSLCDLMHDPERIYQTVNGGFLEQLKVLMKDDDSTVRKKTCKLLHILTAHSIGRMTDRQADRQTDRQTDSRLIINCFLMSCLYSLL
uniref:Rhabdoid tumor deletion region protein 1 n=1 Tax=Dicentrarchus labrax TaxID=13489 RepID=A0A8C4F6G2_DICLA